jgi:hypothetical protein
MMMNNAEEKIFKKKKDVYYITLLVYVVFAVMYILVTGTVTDESVRFGFRDPIVYVVGIFILYTSVMLIMTILRNPRLILTPATIVLKTRYSERTYRLSQIEEILLKRDRRRFNEGTFAIVKMRMSMRRRRIRIRVASYERENELYQEFKQMKEKIRK